MIVRQVMLDFHVIVEVEVPEGTEDGKIADMAYDKFTWGREMTLADMNMEYDGYLLDP